ncbi:MAG: ribose 5-phosphate isomerase B [Eubacteriales bacterium]|nr:ribose 5-phosphate isomerase B [Eubacteriales bacterium]
MKIAIGADHTAIELKETIKQHLTQRGYDVVDYGPNNAQSVDYPHYGEVVARAVAGGDCQLGVLICGTGIGISLAANKVPGIRAAVCSEPYSAKMSRLHNDANILAFGARVVGSELAKMIVDEFLNAEFEGGRHQGRVDMICDIERRR